MAARDARSAGSPSDSGASAGTRAPRALGAASTLSRTSAAPAKSAAQPAPGPLQRSSERDANASHWHVAPANFLILGFVGLALPAANTLSWAWIGALALNVLARLAIPPEPALVRRRLATP